MSIIFYQGCKSDKPQYLLNSDTRRYFDSKPKVENFNQREWLGWVDVLLKNYCTTELVSSFVNHLLRSLKL